MLRKGDHKKLFTHFKVFYVHRVRFVGLDEEHRRSLFNSYEPNSEVKEKPEISEKTSKLADKKRTKLLGGIDVSQVKQVDIFLIPKLNQAKIDAKKKQLDEREMKDCTFAPQTLDYKGTAQRPIINNVTHGDRCKDLYSTKHKGWFKEKSEKTMEDYEVERSKDEMNFKPLINDPEVVKQKFEKNFEKRKVDSIKGIDKVRDRMERARQQQLEKKLMTERGMPAQL